MSEDQQLASRLLKDPRQTLLRFVVGLIRECLLANPPIAAANQFTSTLDALRQLSQEGKISDEYGFVIAPPCLLNWLMLQQSY